MRNLDLWITLTLAATGVAAQWMAIPQPLRLAFAFLLVLICPGYAMVAALFPGRTPGWPERLAIGIGLSLSAAILGAILFNWSPWGLVPALWAGLFFAVTLVSSLIAIQRRAGLTGEALPKTTVRRLRVEHWALIGAAALIAISAVALARAPRPVNGVLGYSLLWMLPDSQQRPDFVMLGISSRELTDTTYHLTITQNGQLIHDVPEIFLSPGETWERLAQLPPLQTGATIEAVLYRQASPEVVYRRVTLSR